MTSKTWTIYITSGVVTACTIALMLDIGRQSSIFLSCDMVSVEDWRASAVTHAIYIFSTLAALCYTVGLLRHYNNVKPMATNYLLLYMAPIFWVFLHSVLGFLYFCGRF